ncbi:mariner Mos1 transposase [Trichonephila clavipes]|nr:mariner Mos1 transposase [Trichonephila clavipes]
MVTGDEKCVTCDNIVRKRSWSKRGDAAQTVSKTGLTDRKVLLCIWWEWKGILYYELLPYGQTLNSDIYCQQLDRLNPDLAPSDYHLFLELQNFLSDKKLGPREDYENRLLKFFANKDQDFYERGITKQPLKWQQIRQQNDAYLAQIRQSETC